MGQIKVTVELGNNVTVTFYGEEAEDIVRYLALDAEDYKPGEQVSRGAPRGWGSFAKEAEHGN